MKPLFCWRCQMEIPMLDEAEFAHVRQFYIRDHPRMLREYQEITGFEETNPAAIMHHRIAQFGGPCTVCGKPLRSPQAAFCAACGKAAD